MQRLMGLRDRTALAVIVGMKLAFKEDKAGTGSIALYLHQVKSENTTNATH